MNGWIWAGIGFVCGALAVICLALMAASGRMSRAEERWELRKPPEEEDDGRG